jgi:hypothetical protein
MADNMMKRTDNLAIHIEGFKQGTLFDQDVEGEITDPDSVQDQVQAIIDRLTSYVDIDAVIAEFYGQQGVVCKSEVVRRAIGQMAKDGKIDLRRDPAITKTGKPSTFLTTSGDKKVVVRAGRTAALR